jgi:DNA-binding CsgD family transcriptional regulator
MKSLGKIQKLQSANTVVTHDRMSLEPSREQTRPKQVDALRGLLVVSPNGLIQFATKQARFLLKNFLHFPPDRLPEQVTRWLEGGSSGRHSSRFIADETGIRLCIQLVCREPGSVCLLLELNPELAITNGARRALTERQIEVLAWVARGKTNAEIARILSLKPGTIGKYLERIFPKLGVENRTAAASFVSRTSDAS